MMAGCDADLRLNHAAQASARVELGPVLTSLPPLNPSHRAVTSSRIMNQVFWPWVRLENRRDRAGTWISVGAPAISLFNNAPRRRPPRLVLERGRPSSAASLAEPRCLHINMMNKQNPPVPTDKCVTKLARRGQYPMIVVSIIRH